MKKVICFVVIGIIALATTFYLTSARMHTADRKLVPAYQWNMYDSSTAAELSTLGFTQLHSVASLKYDKQRKYWKNKTGLTFYGDQEMTKFLDDNDFIIGPSDRYLEEIPRQAVESMRLNFEKVSPYTRFYLLHTTHPDATYTLSEEDFRQLPDVSDAHIEEMNPVEMYLKPEAIARHAIIPPSGTVLAMWDFKGSNVDGRIKVQVIAGAKSFNTEGMQLKDGVLSAIPPRDPVAVIKVADGWLEIAHW